MAKVINLSLGKAKYDFSYFDYKEMNKDSTLIGAIDQGTSSTRFLVFSAKDFQVNLKIPNSNKLSVLFFFLFKTVDYISSSSY